MAVALDREEEIRMPNVEVERSPRHRHQFISGMVMRVAEHDHSVDHARGGGTRTTPAALDQHDHELPDPRSHKWPPLTGEPEYPF